jgi:hypothetical protein
VRNTEEFTLVITTSLLTYHPFYCDWVILVLYIVTNIHSFIIYLYFLCFHLYSLIFSNVSEEV